MCRIWKFAQAAVLLLCGYVCFAAGSSADVPPALAVSADDAQDAYTLPILMYHSILPDLSRAGDYVLPPEVLEEDLRYLREKGYESVTVEDLLAYVDKGTPLPDQPILLSFDDGYYNNCVYLPPLLEAYEMCAVVSPVGSFADAYEESGDRNLLYAMADWSALKALAEHPRIELQNHSYCLHQETPRLGARRCAGESEADYQAMLFADLAAMQDAMESRLGVRPQAFVYPFGAVDEASGQVLRALGFRASFSCSSRHNRITRDPDCLWLLGRYNRPYGISTADFMRSVGID
ncbi:MAG: polysaccharide deacetylase family protein [Ruminococcaceae bacterium]|nr:polysaccharide deacetylase family protein [Oscillospiraceae bacterium]